MGVGLIECETENCDEMIPDPPKNVREKYGGAYCDECRQHINHLGKAPDEEEDDNFVISNDNINDLQKDLDDAKEVLEQMEKEDSIVDDKDGNEEDS